METDSESMTSAVRRLSSPDETERERAFETLTKKSRPYLNAILRSWLPSESDREDAIEEVFHRAWKMREHLQFDHLSGWLTYIRTSARHRAIDRKRLQIPTVSLDDPEIKVIDSSEFDLVDRLVEHAEDCRMLYRLADEALLGLLPSSTPGEDNRNLLVAKLLLVDKWPWQVVQQIVNASADETHQLTRADIDRIASQPDVLCHLAYSELYWESEKLCDYLLDLRKQLASEQSEQELYDTESISSAIILRYRNALFLDQIANRMEGKLKKSELVELFDSCVLHFPFVEIMNTLILNTEGIHGAKEQFRKTGLWHRLAFQYRCSHELPHQDIVDRTEAAAARVGFEMTLGKLTVGLSNGRIFKKMADHLNVRRVDADA